MHRAGLASLLVSSYDFNLFSFTVESLSHLKSGPVKSCFLSYIKLVC